MTKGDFHRREIPLIFPKLGNKNDRHHYEERPSLMTSNRILSMVISLNLGRPGMSQGIILTMERYGVRGYSHKKLLPQPKKKN